MAVHASRRQLLAASPLVIASLPVAKLIAREQEIEEITWALPAINDTMFVPRAWSTYVGAIMSLVQEGPLAIADDLSLTTSVAETSQQVDPTTYTYTLREGVAFGDGSLLTVDDVVASFQYHMKPAMGSQLAAFFSAVGSVEAIGNRTITVKLKAPNVQFRYTPAHMAGFIFKKRQLEEFPEDIGTPDALPLGTGAYRLVEFSPADRVVLEARNDYWGPRPVARRIVFIAIPDRQTRLLAMRNGDIAGTFDLAISDIEQWQAIGNADAITAPSLGVVVLTLDHSRPPFDDVHVRKAIAYSVDRVGLVQALLKGYGEPATALNPPEMWAGVLSLDEVKSFYATLPGYEFDLEKAKSELAQSNHPDGFAITVSGSSADAYQINILQSVSENLKQIGIRMTVQEADPNQWMAGYFRHENLGMQIMAYYPDFADAANYPYLFFSSSTAVAGGMNASNFKNSAVDAALAIANEQSDAAMRAEALKKVFQIANEQVALVPIFWPASAMAINRRYKFIGYNAFWYNVPWAIRWFGMK